MQKLQGVWLIEGYKDTSALLIIKENRLAENFKSKWNTEEPARISIKNKIPSVYIDTIADCRFIEIMTLRDTSYYQILSLTDSTWDFIRYYKICYGDVGVIVNGKKDTSIFYDGERRLCKKIKGLTPRFDLLRASVFGAWGDEDTDLNLHSDSTFSISFYKNDSWFSTNGNYYFNGKNFVLEKLHSKGTENKDPLFDKNHQVHLHYNGLGLWLEETHMILVKMN